MKLLIITQKVDINDDLLGFMHGWIMELVKRCDKITVVALGVGEYHLPSNVKVLSLGKDKLEIENWKLKIIKKFIYLINFYRYIWRERKNYDTVFVHMNKEYVVLGGIFWRLSGKKIALWYNHNEGNFWSRLAGLLAQRIFYTSKFSFFARTGFSKGQLMPAGIDAEVFRQRESIQSSPFSLLFLGRISPVKNLDILIEAASTLDKKNTDFVLNIVGEPGGNDLKYFSDIKELSKDLEAKGKIKFLGKISNQNAPDYYNSNEIFVNLTNSGSFDKTTLEAMACEQLVLVSNRAYEDIFSGEQKKLLMFQEKNADDLARKVESLFRLDSEEKKKITAQMREIVISRHSLKVLADKLFKALSE